MSYTTFFSRAAAFRARAFHSTPLAHKTVKEKVVDGLDIVNKKVGKGLASAIDKGENVAQTTKEALAGASQTTKEKMQEASEAVGKKTGAGVHEGKEDFKKDMK